MWRLFLLLIAVALALCAMFVPGSWPPIAGQLRFSRPSFGGNAVQGPDLSIGLVSQYQGLSTDNVNCGPASVAAIVRAARPDLATLDTASLVASARDKTGEPTGDTDLPGLIRALDGFNVPSAQLYASDAARGNGDPVAAVQFALAQGRPVIITVGGIALGRGPQYGDHFVVVIGMDPRTGAVDVVDPDTQSPRDAAWEPGGLQTWSASLLRAGMRSAQESDALGVVAGAQRIGVISPYLVFLPTAGILALLGLILPRLIAPNRHPR